MVDHGAWLKEQAEIRDVTLVTITGAEAAVIGIADRCSQPPLVVYGYAQLVVHFMGMGMTEEEAMEHIDHNVLGGWQGEQTPLVLTSTPSDP